MPEFRVDVGKDDEQARLFGVRNPKLAAVENEMVSRLAGASGKRKGVAAGVRFGECIGPNRVAGQTRKKSSLLRIISPALNRIGHERVVDVDHDAGGRIDPRKLLDGENGHEKCAPAAAVGFADL